MIRRFLIFLVLALLCGSASAQKHLAIGQVLDGRYRTHQATTDVEMTGDRLRKTYHLVYYHSLTVVDDEEVMNAIAQAFAADAANAVTRDLSHVGSNLYYGFYEYAAEEDLHRYAFFKDMRYAPGDGQQAQVTLIYMEGYATLRMLKQMFGSKER